MKKISQFDGLGAPPGGPPGGAAPPEPTYKVIHSPLDSLGKILADLDLQTYLQNNFGTDPVELAQDIWEMYGGSSNDLEKGKPGKRKENPASSDPIELDKIHDDEYNATRNSRWERLPEGVSIDEITNTDALAKTIYDGFITMKKMKAPAAPGAGPTASLSVKLLKIANTADEKKHYRVADYILEFIRDVHSL